MGRTHGLWAPNLYEAIVASLESREPHVLRGPIRAALKVKKGPRRSALLSL